MFTSLLRAERLRALLLALAATLLAGACAGLSPAPAGSLCTTLDQAACLDSAACTLVLDASSGGGYRCDIASDFCDSAWRQSADGAAACNERPGCRFEPGQCYCAPGDTCVCGGGPPPACVPGEPLGRSAGPVRGSRPA